MPAVPAPPKVVAHRGASAEAPENTLAAVRRAIARDADLVEIDVQRSKDGALVVMHDTTLARTTDVRRVFPGRAPWLVGDFTSDEIARLDAGGGSEQYAGERVPTLEQVVDVVRHSRTGLLVELKATALHPGLAADVATALHRVPGYVDDAVAQGRLVVQSFDHDAMRHHKKLAPSVPVGALGTPTKPELGALATWADYVNPVHWSARPAYVEAVHRHGMRCHVWTVNRPAHMRRALDLGVDGVITNHPGRLRRLVDDVHRLAERTAS